MAVETKVIHESETILEDDYPVNAGYLYLADGEVVSSPVQGTVARLKAALGATVIRRCDIGARNLW